MNTKMYPLGKLPKRVFAVAHLPNFHAQVFSAYYKDYRNQSLAVTEQAIGRHKTVILSSSKEAQSMGVLPGVPIHEIDQDILDRIKLVPRSKKLEQNAHKDILSSVDSITPAVIRLSENEFLLDITGTPTFRDGGPEGVGDKLKLCLKNDPGFFDVSVGIARSKICAQVIARCPSCEKKTICYSADDLGYLQASVDLLPGLMDFEKEKLHKLGIMRIGQMRNFGRGVLKKLFGKSGERLLAASMGMDLGVMASSNELILEEEVLETDVNDLEELFKMVLRVTDRVFDRIQKDKMLAKKLALTITYGDNQKSKSSFDLSRPSNRLEDTKVLRTLFLETYTRRVALRAISIKVLKTMPDHGQLSLFDSDDHKNQKRTQAIQSIRTQFGFDAIENGNYFGVSKTVK